MRMRGYYFLASPFQGSEIDKEPSYNLSKHITAYFLSQNISLFVPILYNELLIQFFPQEILENRRTILMPMNMDFYMLLVG